MPPADFRFACLPSTELINTIWSQTSRSGGCVGPADASSCSCLVIEEIPSSCQELLPGILVLHNRDVVLPKGHSLAGGLPWPAVAHGLENSWPWLLFFSSTHPCSLVPTCNTSPICSFHPPTYLPASPTSSHVMHIKSSLNDRIN